MRVTDPDGYVLTIAQIDKRTKSMAAIDLV